MGRKGEAYIVKFVWSQFGGIVKLGPEASPECCVQKLRTSVAICPEGSETCASLNCGHLQIS